MSSKKLALMVTRISALILFGTLLGASVLGVDIGKTLLGTHWSSPVPEGRLTVALEGIIVSVVILFGGLMVAGMIALVVNGENQGGETQKEKDSKP